MLGEVVSRHEICEITTLMLRGVRTFSAESVGVLVVWCGVLSEIEWLALVAGVLISLLG